MKNKKTKKVKAIKPKKIKKVKAIKPKKIKKVKVSKKKGNGIPDNQIENLAKWLAYHKEHGKLPHNRIICSNCNMDYIGLKGIGMSWAMKKFNNDLTRVLTESICKTCVTILTPKEAKEPKEKIVQILTREEMQARRDAISETLPKIDFYKTRTIIDISKDKDMCKSYTYFSCHRPDIYLDYGCEECVLNNHCACPIKDTSRIADGRHKMKKKK
jgi:hypothetical protein